MDTLHSQASAGVAKSPQLQVSADRLNGRACSATYFPNSGWIGSLNMTAQTPATGRKTISSSHLRRGAALMSFALLAAVFVPPPLAEAIPLPRAAPNARPGVTTGAAPEQNSS